MTPKPTFSFDSLTSTGLDKVPLNNIILIEDSNGSGKPKQIIIKDKTGVTAATTVSAFLALTAQWEPLSIFDGLAGIIVTIPTSSIPAGFLECDGSAISRTVYADLFTNIGTTYGVGDGSTTFNLPDLRGEFIRGFDNGRGIDSGRAIGSAQGDAIRNITGSTTQKTVVTYLDAANSTYVTGAMTATGHQQTASAINNSGTSGDQAYDIGIDASKVVPTASENRPRNIAMMYCIKY